MVDGLWHCQVGRHLCARLLNLNMNLLRPRLRDVWCCHRLLVVLLLLLRVMRLLVVLLLRLVLRIAVGLGRLKWWLASYLWWRSHWARRGLNSGWEWCLWLLKVPGEILYWYDWSALLASNSGVHRGASLVPSAALSGMGACGWVRVSWIWSAYTVWSCGRPKMRAKTLRCLLRLSRLGSCVHTCPSEGVPSSSPLSRSPSRHCTFPELALRLYTRVGTVLFGGSMEKLSGLIIDAYDDSDGRVLRHIFPEQTDLSELEKHAHALTPEEHSALPDEAFALVLVNDGQEFRKFATIDAGNTTLSIMYFLKTAHRLPMEAQEVAAANLEAACALYGLDAPELLKEAVAQPYRKAKGVARYVQLMKGDRADAMEQFAKDRTRSVVLDLRGLGGGRTRMSKPSISFGKTRAEANANAAREAAKDQSRGKAWQKMNDLASDERVYSGATRAGTALGAVGAVGTATALASKSNKNTAEKGINEKNASVMFKEAFGALGLLSGALVIPEQARQAKMNLSATKGSGGAVMTPGQIQQRKAQMGMY